MNRIVGITMIIGLAAACARKASAAEVDGVAQWNVVALEATREHPPLAQVRALALVHAAMFDAANGLERRFDPYLVDMKAGGDVSGAAALASSAHTVLASLAPERRASLDAALVATLSPVPSGSARDQGVAFGRRVAEAVLALRIRDGAGAVHTYQPGDGAGAWRPTPPGHLPAMAAHWGEVRPLLIAAAAGFAPPAPPAITSAHYARDFAEVKAVGARNSAQRTPDQTAAAVFWTGFAAPIWSSAARQALASRPRLTLVERARVLALMSGAMADAAIVGWAAKFRYRMWRPVTAVRLAADDGNHATVADSAWEPLVATPPFPCYISGHAIFAGAAERALALALGDDRLDLRITNPDVGLTRRYTSFAQLAHEAHDARIWAGVHFRVSQVEGLAAGRRIGEAIARSRLQPIPPRHTAR
jgi:hypothetical protein